MLIPKKSLGQNFLLDKNLCKKIVNTIKIKDEIILEIGPGTGQLTQEILLKKPKKLILIEKDSKLCQLLKEKFSNLNNIEILNEDALHFIYKTNKKINIISNLPYNISTKLIIYLLKNYKNINFLVLMLQKEVAIKMDTELSKKNKLNFFIEFLSDYKILFNVSNKVFYPKPKIKSSVISIKPKNEKVDFEKLENFNNKIFKFKRKKIKNVINFKIDNKNLQKILNKRSEDLKTSELKYLFYKF